MAVFDWAESPGTASELRARTVATQFGDGYQAIATDGLNPVQQVWDVVIDRAAALAADEIEAFIKPKLGRVPFDWTPPRQTVALKWLCTGFSRAITETVDEHNLRLRFEQWFQP